MSFSSLVPLAVDVDVDVDVDDEVVEEERSILARTTASVGHFFLLSSRQAAMASGVFSFGGRI